MSIHNSRLLAGVCIVVATLTGYGCDAENGWRNDGPDRIGPTAISFNGIGEPTTNSTDVFAHGVTLQPAIVTPEVVTSAVCPVRPPFVAPVQVVVAADSDADLSLSQVDMRFVDRRGNAGESTTLTRAELVDLFGSTLVRRGSRRVFPFTFPFGCTGDRIGTITVAVFTGDPKGRRSRSLSVDVR